MKEWPAFAPRPRTGRPSTGMVPAAPPGERRDRAIEEWARAVWESWKHEHGRIDALLEGTYRVRGR